MRQLRAAGFDFAAAFPASHAAFSAGKFHWASLRGAGAARTLELARGECTNPSGERRAARPCFRVQRPFASFHAVMEAVEAGWAADSRPAVSRNH